jgi:DNA-binding PadR family transcriptional regulator
MPESSERGALTEAVYFILLSLYEPLHGYGIIKNVKALSHDRVILGPGTLYGAVSTLLGKGWIVPVDERANDRKKEYLITESGKAAVRQEVARLAELLALGKERLKRESV